MSSGTALTHVERVRAAIELGESHFREFKSAWSGSPSQKSPRVPKDIKRDIGEALVAFANADGGEFLLGVEDDGTVTGVPHSEKDILQFLDAAATHVHHDTPLPNPARRRVEIDGETVLHIMVEKSTRHVHLTNAGRCLQRRDRESVPVASEQIHFERQEQLSRAYDRQFVDGADLMSLDPAVLARVGDELASGLSREKLLQLVGLADFVGDSVRLRRAALLLFANDIARWHPRCEVRILRIDGTELRTGKDYNVVRDEVVTGSIFALISGAWEALRPHLVQTRFGPEGIFEEHIMYPEDACREALTNAIAHRDYSIEGRGVEVSVYDDRMEVVSPGPLLSNVSLEGLRSLSGAHESRNTLVARVLRELGYMREMGEGMRRIFALMRAHDLIEPGLFVEGDSFRVELHHRSVFSEDAQRWLLGYEKADLTRAEQKVVLLGRDGALLSPQQIWDALDIVDTEDYRRIVERLQLKGLLHSPGRRRRGAAMKGVPRYAIRPPEEFERHFADLLQGFAKVGHRDQVSTESVRRARGHLDSKSPWARESQLRKSVRFLSLIDDGGRPIGRLRAVLDATADTGSKMRVAERVRPIVRRQRSEPSGEESQELQTSVPTTLFVGNLPYGVTAGTIRALFAPHGTIRRVTVPRDVHTGQGRGYAFVDFEDAHRALDARAALNGFELDGRQLRIDWDRRS